MSAIDTTRTVPAAAHPISIAASRMVAAIVEWNDARATRKALSSLSDRALEDIGLSRGDIAKVAAR